MILKELRVENFRNFSRKAIPFSGAINVIYGFNGQGKTNLLEAISVACLARSFRTHRDADLIYFERNHYSVEADITFDSGVEKSIRVEYSLSDGKKISVDNERVPSIIEFFGNFPLVILSPEDDAITAGTPADRRSFLNLTISLFDRRYLGFLQDFQKILKQRNRILQEAAQSRFQFSKKMEPWNESFYKVGMEITKIREAFLKEFEPVVQKIHRTLTDDRESIQIQYSPSFSQEWDQYEKFLDHLETIKNDEVRRGMSLIGPQRDDIQILMNRHELRKFGSRGQHRTVLLSLKIAIYHVLEQKKKEKPLFLLDDVYSEIDEIREKAFNEYFLQLNQLFLTTHEQELKFNLPDAFDKEIRYILVDNADVKSVLPLGEEG